MSSSKPSLPEGYQIPRVWQNPQAKEGSPFGGMNRPTAGPRTESALPVGEHPLQLYSLGTPNGQKVTIMLEELNLLQGVEYDGWRIDIIEQDQFKSGFVELNPNSKIPAMRDNSVTPARRVFESGSILLYLAEKYNAFIPKDPTLRTECISWLMWQVGTAPFIGGGFGHFYKYAPVQIEYCIDRYAMETKRIVDVLDRHLMDKKFVCGDEYSIADMAIYPWIRCIEIGYNAKEFLEMEKYKNVQRWSKTLLAKKGVQRGLRVNAWSNDAVKERHSAKDFD